MAEIKFPKGETKLRSVPIAVTPEGFWCCPSPAAFQKNLKHVPTTNKPKPPPSPIASSQKKKPTPTPISDDVNGSNGVVGGEKVAKSANKVENLPKKVSIEFGESGTSDVKVVLYGKHGFCVKLNVHRNVIVENSSFFADKLGGGGGRGVAVVEEEDEEACVRIEDCDDVEIYVETVGLMYSKDMKLRLVKQSVQRVLRILKVAEVLGFTACINSCLDYLEAVPWVGDEEEKNVISSVLQLQTDRISINPVLKRVSSKISNPPKDTLSHIISLVLNSCEEKGRREMKSIVLKLLRENTATSDHASSADICYETIYALCKTCLDSLLHHFRRATELEPDQPVSKKIALDADNLAWLLDILAERQLADEFASVWAHQQELAGLHQKLPVVARFHVSCITARVFVGIGKGEMLPSKETRHLLLQTWLEPLINDYSWLNHGCRSFDRAVVEEGIGRTILTLPLEDQQSVLLAWLSNFLKYGDNCPNLQRAFEVWWRRTFVRAHVEPRVNHGQPDKFMASRNEPSVNREGVGLNNNGYMSYL